MDVDYEFGPAFTLMTANLGPGESIKVEPGAMVAQSSGLDVQTGMSGGGGIGGFLKSMAKSAFGGESFFLNTYTGGPSGGWISLSPSAPGDINTFDIEPNQNLFMLGGRSWPAHRMSTTIPSSKARSLCFLEKVCSS